MISFHFHQKPFDIGTISIIIILQRGKNEVQRIEMAFPKAHNKEVEEKDLTPEIRFQGQTAISILHSYARV